MGKPETEENEEVIDPIQKSIGSIGRWQCLMLIPAFMVKLPIAWQQLNIVFLAPPVEFFCKLPGSEVDKCSSECLEHEFNRSIFTETIVTQWDLVCDRYQLANLSQTLVMLGILIGSVVFGSLCDIYGRKPVMMGTLPFQIIFGVASAFIPQFWLFLIFRFLNAVATGGTVVTSFVFVVEIVGVEWRAFMGVIYQMPFCIGYMTLPVFSYYIRDWRYLQLCLSLPPILILFFYFIIPESPRWLLTQGKIEQAIKILTSGAEFNGMPTKDIENDVIKAVSQKNLDVDCKKTGSALDLMRNSNLRIKTIVICFNGAVCGMCFFGVAQYVGQSSTNIFINVGLSAVTQLPAILLTIPLLKYLGRKKTQILAHTATGVCCLLIIVIPPNPTWIRTSSSILGLFWAGISFSTFYIWGGELFPTVLRTSGIGIATMISRIGSMIAPFIAGLIAVKTFLPPIIFGVFPLLAVFTCFLLPETLKQQLPDTIEDAEKVGKNKKQIVPEETRSSEVYSVKL